MLKSLQYTSKKRLLEEYTLSQVPQRDQGMLMSEPLQKRRGLHAFTGCDSTSAFVGKGKKQALITIKSNKELWTTFKHFGNLFEVSPEKESSCEKFVFFLYVRKSDGDVLAQLDSLSVLTHVKLGLA